MATSSWVDGADDSPFPATNLPYGIFSTADDPTQRVGVAIGDKVLDVTTTAPRVDEAFASILAGPTLNPLMAAGRPLWGDVRDWVTDLVTAEQHRPAVEPRLHDRGQVTLHLPIAVADYVDFYSSRHHAENVGRIFRPDEDPLPPNWRHLPIGYHGRSASIVVSGTDVVRPAGQRKNQQARAPVFGPSVSLDIEAELGFVVGTGNPLGEPINVAHAEEHHGEHRRQGHHQETGELRKILAREQLVATLAEVGQVLLSCLFDLGAKAPQVLG